MDANMPELYGAYMAGLWRGTARKLAGSLAGSGYDPESKRTMSVVWGGIGAALIVVGLSLEGPELSIGVGLMGLFCIVLAFGVANAAGAQQRVESAAVDLIEWGREAIAFRRAIGPLRERLAGAPFRTFASNTGYRGSFEHLLENAGWPDDSGPAAETLRAYLAECLPPPGHRSAIHELQRGDMHRQMVGLIDEWKATKDVLEIWSIALDVGGSRAPTLRKIIRTLRERHLDSVRLMWFLSIAHTEKTQLPGEPDYSFVSCIRDVMLSAPGEQ